MLHQEKKLEECKRSEKQGDAPENVRGGEGIAEVRLIL